MRVFYAVTFNKKTKDKLHEYQKLVINNSIKGRFTEPNNLHITLEFIGEVDKEKLNILTSILHKLQERPKELTVLRIGSFRRQSKEIVWLGIEENQELIRLQKELKELLTKNGFETDKRKFTPHITIGRQVERASSLEDIRVNPTKAPIHSMALMVSKRVSGKLVYEPVEEIIV